jgi:hypothetical protein
LVGVCDIYFVTGYYRTGYTVRAREAYLLGIMTIKSLYHSLLETVNHTIDVGSIVSLESFLSQSFLLGFQVAIPQCDGWGRENMEPLAFLLLPVLV